VALGVGVAGPEQIELVTDDAAGEAFLSRLKPLLLQG
jgi:hypothetical protein